MWGAIAGAALSTLGSLFGGSAASKAEKKKKEYIEGELKENENWYNRRYNEDFTQRADAQRALTLAEERIKNRNRAMAGQQAVMGGTEESTAATKAANAQTLSDATAQIAAQGAANKDQVESQYRQNKSQLKGQLENVEEQRAQNTINAVNGVAQAGASLLNATSMNGSNANGSSTGATNVSSPIESNRENATLKNLVNQQANNAANFQQATSAGYKPTNLFEQAAGAYTGIDPEIEERMRNLNKVRPIV